MYCNKKGLKSCKRLIWSASIFILHYVTLDQISNDCCNLIKRRTMKVICEHANFFLRNFQLGMEYTIYINNIPQGDVYLLQLLEIVLHPSFVELSVDNRKYFLTYYCSRTFLCVSSNGSSEKKWYRYLLFLTAQDKNMITNMEEYECYHSVYLPPHNIAMYLIEFGMIYPCLYLLSKNNKHQLKPFSISNNFMYSLNVK